MIFVFLIIALQCGMSVLLYRLNWPIPWCIALFFSPFGIGLFLLQLFYYERHYPNWHVPFHIKLKLKYMYILTFFEFVFLYLLLFVVK
ncbi:hypothetical protein BU649_02800 [Staphylococcus chromogenes]|uniref:Uncharacterized protein n=2 Tax=Staphylococcus chromogenes TaxID=46126 RepID=A0AAE5W9E2_STACR|nr:hypothetical protein SCHR_01965 [Staphylococcus chromogenes MU 970]PNY93515.1 hypothetical protein CD151_07470 [Staphylococcus chromogenes]PTF32387.1 hypothetical protein BUY14_00155 [Staphylococcus chromogenes]PTF39516.1 hypothetical protein BUY17_05030 [Staphylococcus chromogenes]PTF42149.1 hypothetical protein BUY11_06550 [Staphylococcus chromogenes]